MISSITAEIFRIPWPARAKISTARCRGSLRGLQLTAWKISRKLAFTQAYKSPE